MYQPQLTARDRAATIVMVAAIHVALVFALINLSPPLREQLPEEVVEIFDVTEPPPPEVAVVEEIPAPQEDAPKEEEGAASAENIRSQATPVVAPKPPIQLPIPQPMPVTQTPNTGSERTQGASNVVGPGTGAGGVGTGTGSGGSGRGTGGGGLGEGTRPQLITPTLDGRRDYPREILRRWPRGGRVFVRFQVSVDGRPFNCRIDRSSGDVAVDQWTCSLAESKLRFRPARRPNGEPYVSWFGYIQAPTNF